MAEITKVLNLTKITESFIEKDVLTAGQTVLNSSNIEEVSKSASEIARAFGAAGSEVSVPDEVAAKKLISSFNSNLTLLIQKTWVEKSDAEIKEQVLYQLEQLHTLFESETWKKIYTPFLKIIYDSVYLMFGAQTKKEDFLEYAFRVDPEFGIFWWYIQMLPLETDWSEEKCRIIVLLGMYFLANY